MRDYIHWEKRDNFRAFCVTQQHRLTEILKGPRRKLHVMSNTAAMWQVHAACQNTCSQLHLNTHTEAVRIHFSNHIFVGFQKSLNLPVAHVRNTISICRWCTECFLGSCVVILYERLLLSYPSCNIENIFEYFSVKRKKRYTLST